MQVSSNRNIKIFTDEKEIQFAVRIVCCKQEWVSLPSH